MEKGRRLKCQEISTEPFLREFNTHLADFYLKNFQFSGTVHENPLKIDRDKNSKNKSI